VDDGLLAWVSSLSIPLVMVVHVNHAHEIDTEVGTALTRLRGAGVTLLNQSVLLRGINDSAAALAALSERLFRFGVLPYYLHQFDPVVGAMHFAVADATAQRIDQELRTRLPGYLVPRLVREVAGAPAKLPL
jgi:L-lysine 2,3-aminomutase